MALPLQARLGYAGIYPARLLLLPALAPGCCLAWSSQQLLCDAIWSVNKVLGLERAEEVGATFGLDPGVEGWTG